MSWDAGDDLDKKLLDLIKDQKIGAAANAALQMSRERHEALADAVIDKAMSGPYTGPRVGGDMLAGWPLDQLLMGVVSSADKAAVIAAIRSRYPVLHAGGSGMPLVPPRRYQLSDMLCMRMGWDSLERGTGFDHVAVHRAGDKVFVWVITKDAQTATIEDDSAMFPSDPLITKLRLLQQQGE